MPKVLSTPFKAQVISLSALLSAEGERTPHPIRPVRALRVYIERSSQFRQSEQLFVCFGGCSKGLPVMKQRLPHWIVDTIALAYKPLDLQCPVGVSGWSSPSTFIRFYNLDVPALQVRVLSV